MGAQAHRANDSDPSAVRYGALWLRRVTTQLGHLVSIFQVLLARVTAGSSGVERLLLRKSKSQTLFIMRRLGANIDASCDLESPLVLHNTSGNFRHLTIGPQTHIGKLVFLDLAAPIKIGPRATISMECMILTHTDVGNSILGADVIPRTQGPVEIGADAYLGARAMILPGVRIGNQAVVGAGSVVTRDVPDGQWVAGLPARPMRSAEGMPTSPS